MTGTARPLDSGRKDALGRTIRIADDAATGRADAPAPPNLDTDADAVLYELAEHGIHRLADLEQLHHSERVDQYGIDTDTDAGAATWNQIRQALRNHDIVVADRAVRYDDPASGQIIVMPYDGNLDDAALDDMADRLAIHLPHLDRHRLRQAIRDDSSIMFNLKAVPTGPDSTDITADGITLSGSSDQFGIADMRPTRPHRYQPFDQREKQRLVITGGVHPATADKFAEHGIRRPETIIAWNQFGHGTPEYAAAQIAAGSPGPADLNARPARINIGSLGDDLPANTDPHSTPYGTARIGSRDWEGAPQTVETVVGHGLPGFRIVGVPGGQERETRDKVRAAIMSAGYHWPSGKITVHPQHEQTPFDSRSNAAVAYSILQASGQIGHGNPEHELWGDIGLDGTIHDIEP